MEPETYEHVMLDPKWEEAMTTELHDLERNHTWMLTPLPLAIIQLGANGYTKLNITLMTLLRDTKPGWWQRVLLNVKGSTIRRH